jgi:hypothetical protein
MSKFLRCSAYLLFVFALLFQPEPTRADSIPTVTITSGTGGVTIGIPGEGYCCVGGSLSGPNFNVSVGGSIPPFVLDTAAGTAFDTFFLDPQNYVAPDSEPSGFLVFDGIKYPATYSVGLGAASFTVPSGYATVEEPAVFTAMGMACTAIYAISTPCEPPPGTKPYPVIIADIDVDIPGTLAVTFRPVDIPSLPGINEAWFATFTPIPEPSTMLLLFAALPFAALFAVRNKKG